MKKRTIQKACALLLTGAMVFGLGACGSSSADTTASTAADTGTTDGQSVESTSASSGETAEIYWFSDVTGWGPTNTSWPEGGTVSTKIY